MSSQPRIIAFKNTNEGSLGVDVPGLGHVTLWDKGDVIMHKGKPYVDERLNNIHFVRLGLKPIYDVVPSETKVSPVVPVQSQAKETQPPAKSLMEKGPTSLTSTSTSTSLGSAPSALNEASSVLVNEWNVNFDRATEEWVLTKDGYRTKSPPGMKQHVRAAFGADAVEKLNWEKI
jgi:hypothetical protein